MLPEMQEGSLNRSLEGERQMWRLAAHRNRVLRFVCLFWQMHHLFSTLPCRKLYSQLISSLDIAKKLIIATVRHFSDLSFPKKTGALVIARARLRILVSYISSELSHFGVNRLGPCFAFFGTWKKLTNPNFSLLKPPRNKKGRKMF